MIFETEKGYTLAEIERDAGVKAMRWPYEWFSVIDVEGNWAQYDFVGSSEKMYLVLVDGEKVGPLPGEGE